MSKLQNMTFSDDVKMVWEAQHSTHSFIVMLKKIFKNNFCLLSDINHTSQVFHRSFFSTIWPNFIEIHEGVFELSENVHNVTISKATLETDPYINKRWYKLLYHKKQGAFRERRHLQVFDLWHVSLTFWHDQKCIDYLIKCCLDEKCDIHLSL